MPLSRRMVAFALAAVMPMLAAVPALAQPGKRGKDPWMTYWPQVQALAKKQDKVILIYFKITGEDWCEKLDKDVMDTAMFLSWAEENVMMMKVDFDPNQRTSPTIKRYQRELKEKYAIKLAPTVLFLNPEGQELARASYDDAKLRKEEPKGAPRTWLKFCKRIAEERPDPTQLKTIDSLTKAQAYAKEHQVALLIVLTKNPTPDQKKKVSFLLGNAQFKQFAEVSLAVTKQSWPDPVDPSPDAYFLSKFIKKHALTEVPLQLVLWDPVKDTIAHKMFAFSAANLTPVMRQMRGKLPQVPYKGEWLTDFKKARAISVAQRRFTLLSFTDVNNSEFCQKLKKEIYDTELFQEYAKRYLVVVDLDLPKDGKGKDPKLLKAHNQIADMYSIRGFPTLVILNDKGEKVATAGLMKGGPEALLESLDQIRKNDLARRDPASEW